MNRTHGMSRTRIYRVWVSMRLRCDPRYASDYPNYSGRGVRVCSRWEDFEAFHSDMGPDPGAGFQLDRIDNDGNYEPGNVRWATKREQALNRRPYPPGRSAGERNAAAKLTWATVAQVRAARERERLSFAVLASRFGISTSQAHRICKGASWT